MSSPDQADTSDPGSEFRFPTSRGRGRSRSVSSNGNSPRLSRSHSFSTMSQAHNDLDQSTASAQDEEEAVIDDDLSANEVEAPVEAAEDEWETATDDDLSVDEVEAPVEAAEDEEEAVIDDDLSANEVEAPVEAAEDESSGWGRTMPEHLPENAEEFFSREWENPTETLKSLINHLVETNFTTYDAALGNWLETNKSALEAAAVTDTHDLGSNEKVQPTHTKINLEALGAFKAEYEQRTQAESSEASRLEWQYDPGYRMLEERGSKNIQTEKIDSVLLVDGKLVGNPPKETLTKIIIAPKEALDSLIFHTDYVVPDHNYSYITIHVSAWTQRWKSPSTELTRLARIEIPMVKCQGVEPKIEALTRATAAKLLGVEECTHMVAKYTVTGDPRFFHEDCPSSFFDNPKIKEQLASLEEICASPKVEISILHAMLARETDDPKDDGVYQTLQDCSDGWRRDGENPLAVYFVNSPSKQMLDIGTVPKGENIPFVHQVPARTVFENPQQYRVAMAIGTQQEKEYQDRQNRKLLEVEVPARFIADARTLHPQSKAPQEYFMLIDLTALGEKDYLLPRVGDSAKITPLGIFVTQQAIPKGMTEQVNLDIAHYIQDCVGHVKSDRSINDQSGFDDKLQDELQILCVRDENDSPIAKNLETLRSKLEDICEVYSDDEALLEFVRSNREWLRERPPRMDEDINPISNPVILHAHRIAVSSPLWPATTQVWKITVPIDKATGNARLPMILEIRDAKLDDKGELLTRKGFVELGKSGKAVHKVKITIVDSDKTYKAQMNAFKKLSAPHTMPLDDRPSVASLQLFEDLIKADLRDGKPLKEFMPVLESLWRGTHNNEKLQRMYGLLAKDKHKAIQGLLDDKKMIKYVHGPPGTGKSYLLLFLVCVALLCDPPTGSNDDERNLPVDAGKQLSPAEFDKVDQTNAPRPVQLTNEQRAAIPTPPTSIKILVTSGQNTAVDDLVPRLKTMWKEQGFKGSRSKEPVILRMHSLQVESRDFPRRLAKLRPDIVRDKDESASGILMRLLCDFSDKVDEYEREGRRQRRPNPSVVDKAIELYKADEELPLGDRKYKQLAEHILKIKDDPDTYFTTKKQISALVKDGPQKDAIMLADVVFTTPVGASDRTFHTNFRPHIIFSDEVSRDKEMESNITIAHFSPVAYIAFGDHKQLTPIVFSAFQHLKYKAPKSAFKKDVDIAQATGAESSGGNDHEEPEPAKPEPEEPEPEKPEPEEPEPAKPEPEEPEPEKPESEEPEPEKPEPEEPEPEKPEPEEPEPEKPEPEEPEPLPRPATFAPQLKKTTIHRLVEAGHPTYKLQENHRAHGEGGSFFNKQYYNNSIRFKAGSFTPADKATTRFLEKLKGGQINDNSLMIDMSSYETSIARSFMNVAHVNYVLQSLVDLLSDPDFAPTRKRPNDGTVMIVVPYDKQRDLYIDELQKRATKEFNSEGVYVDFDKSRIDIRTHHGAQGHEASIVIVDLVRSSGPGHTGSPELVTVCSSRFTCGQVVLMNQRVIDHVETKLAPNIKHLVAWQKYHMDKNMFIQLDSSMAKGLQKTCFRCHMYGHKGNECPSVTSGRKLVCPNPRCARNHHFRDCYFDPRRKGRVNIVEEAKKPVADPKPDETVQPAQQSAIPTEGSERERNFGRRDKNRMRQMLSAYKGEGGPNLNEGDQTTTDQTTTETPASWGATGTEWNEGGDDKDDTNGGDEWDAGAGGGAWDQGGKQSTW